MARDSLESVVVELDNALLTKWRYNANVQKTFHSRSYSYFKRLADATAVVSVSISLLVGCFNLAYGIVGPTEAESASVVSGCLSLCAGSIVGVANSLGWAEKSAQHNHYAARYGEISRDINTEAMLKRMDDGTFASEAEFIKHISAQLDRIEENAPTIPGVVERASKRKNTSSVG